MKTPLLPLAVLFLTGSLALATGSHAPSHSRSSHHGGHRAPRRSTVSVPHAKRHVTYAEKKVLFDRAGIPRNQWHNYIVDHRTPLELGGSNDLSNLQVMDKVSAKRKDRVENYLAAKVRHGEMSLAQARAEIQNWQSVDATH